MGMWLRHMGKLFWGMEGRSWGSEGGDGGGVQIFGSLSKCVERSYWI